MSNAKEVRKYIEFKTLLNAKVKENKCFMR